MNKLLLLILCIISQFSYADDTKPGTYTYNSHMINLRFFKQFKKAKKFHFLTEISSGKIFRANNRKLKIGSYYNWRQGQRFGAFLEARSGQRHTDDWILKSGKWKWEETDDRFETSLLFNHSYRHLPKLDFPLVLDLKTEFLFNTFNEHQTFTLSPGINYFFLDKKRQPLYSLHAYLPLYLALNYEKEALYKKGVYLSALHHVKRRFQYGLEMKYTEVQWSESKEYKDQFPSDSYLSENQNITTTLNLIFHL